MRAKEIIQRNLASAAPEQPADVDEIRKRNYSNNFQPKKHTMDIINNCHSCGSSHRRRHCPAYGKSCNKCGKSNHFAKVCRSKAIMKSTTNAVQVPDATTDVNEEPCMFNVGLCSNVKLNACNSSVWFENFVFGKTKVAMKVDTGAQVNVLTRDIFEDLDVSRELRKAGTKLTGYTGHVIPVDGVVELPFSFRGKTYKSEFYVTTAKNTPLLGLPTIKELGLIGIDQVEQVDTDSSKLIVEEFKDVFEGFGKLDIEHHITLRPEAKPVVCNVRPVPINVKPKLKAELDRLEKLEIIQRCNEPSDWVSPIVVAEKPNNQIRLCLDPRLLNKEIMREHYKLPTATEIYSRIGQSKFFSTLDATNGFHQIPLDVESCKLTTFITPYGRYNYKRLPFGLNSSAEVFHKTMCQKLGDIEGIEIYIDDLLIHAPTKEIHDRRLREVLLRCREINLKLNSEKCAIGRQVVNFLGHEISGDGILPKRNRAKAIQEMLTPTCKNDVQRFLGFVNYLGKFCPDLANETQPLRQLLKKNTTFIWEKAHNDAFVKIKQLVSNAPLLKHFNSEEEITLQVDASSFSLGAVLMQKGQPVEFAAKSLTDTQKRYAQIEKELLAVLFGCRKFHYYVYGGSKFFVQTDHKPLLGIVEKNIEDTNPRIRRMLLELMSYDFKLVYKKGNEMYIADMLSRASYPDIDTSVNVAEFDPMNKLPEMIFCSDIAKAEYKQAVLSDRELQALKLFVINGWPPYRKSCSFVGRKYWPWRNEIGVCDEFLFVGSKLMVPMSKQTEILQKLHKSHQGIVKTKALAKTVVFWPGINNQIEEMIQSCVQCRENIEQQCRQPMMASEIPKYPFHTVAADLFSLDGSDFMLIVDYFSKWLIIEPLKTTTSLSVIQCFEKTFADFGVACVLRSDNGPQFTSQQFKIFLNEQGIEHLTSSPGYPQSNGCAERYVRTAKALLKKCKAEGKTFYGGLRNLRNTPISDKIPSPAVLLQGRVLPDTLPRDLKTLFPNSYDKQVIQNDFEMIKSTQKLNYDRHAKSELSVLKPGQRVRAKINDKWILGKIQKQDLTGPRSYWVVTDENKL